MKTSPTHFHHKITEFFKPNIGRQATRKLRLRGINEGTGPNVAPPSETAPRGQPARPPRVNSGVRIALRLANACQCNAVGLCCNLRSQPRPQGLLAFQYGDEVACVAGRFLVFLSVSQSRQSNVNAEPRSKLNPVLGSAFAW